METETALLSGREGRLVEGLGVTLTNIVDQGRPLIVQGIVEHRAAYHPGGDPADGRVQGRDTDLGLGQGTDRRQGLVHILLGRRVAGYVHGQDIGERSDLGRSPLKGG